MIDLGFLLLSIGAVLIGGFCTVCAAVVIGAFLYAGWKSKRGGESK